MKNLITLAFFLISSITFSQSIYEIQGQTAESPYNSQTVTTKGIVTAVYSNSYFIQDGDSAWCGLYIYDQTQTPTLGDSIKLTGTLTEYYEMTELKDLTAYNVLSTGNIVPEPIIVPTGQADEKWESVLIKVENATCTNTDLGYGEWEVNDGSGSLVIDDMGVAFSPIIDVTYNITGPLNYSFSLFKLEPQTKDAIAINLPIFFTKSPKATNIQPNNFDLSMTTNVESKAIVEYGLTPAFELNKTFSTVSSTTHNVTLNNLEAGSIYYAKSYAINNSNDTTPLFTGVYATQSESSGKIKTYFNHAEMVYPLKDGFTKNIVDTIIYYINKAKTSLDITMYDLTNHATESDSSNYKLIQAVNIAYNSGVKVRFITDDLPTNSALDSLNSQIPLVRGNIEAIMHNKFLIIDANNADNAWVVTGSTNWTYNNLFMDFNNMICIQDQSLAKAYEIEFNEMWGSNSETPDENNAKFGSEKVDNTPHIFNIGGYQTELYFSPSDKTTSKIVNAIDNAKLNINFAMMVFTENQLGTAMINAHKRDVIINGFIDYVEYSGSEFGYLNDNGLAITDFSNESGQGWPDDKTLHHKFCIIDGNSRSPLLITGTHNWSASAESKNDENTLFIYNPGVAHRFNQEYEQIYNYMYGGGSVSGNIEINLKVFPNPSAGKLSISFTSNEQINQVNIYSLTGQKIKSSDETNSSKVEIEIKQKGLFFIEAIGQKSRIVQKVIID